MRKLFGAAALVISAVLTACGGGGGSSGATDLPYSITLRADKAQLPINISNEQPGLGAYARFTTALYVE
ncbi:MAG: Ig domain-containing protein, partial [Giesbergeria sp.]